MVAGDKSKSILVIEDDKVQRKIIESALKPHGYVSIHAQSGEDALKILKTECPGLILLDIILPGMNGFQTLKRIRRLPDSKDIPVIILTVLDQEDFNLADSGAIDYITKPFKLRDLVSRVNAVFRTTGTVSPQTVKKKEIYRDFAKADFKIVENEKCPMYEYGDRFRLSGISFQTPGGKPTCMSLVKEVEVFMKFASVEKSFPENGSGDLVYCGGCTGNIKLEYIRIGRNEQAMGESGNINNTVHFLSKIPLFQSFDIESIKDLVLSIKLKNYKAGSVVIRKGEKGKYLYIIISGRVDVLGNSDAHIATLGKGEVFGEMSLISGDPVGATIKVMKTSKIMELDGDYFRKLLNKNPAIQLHMSRLLARRLARSNVAVSEEKDCGMMGKLSEILPSVLLQTLNMNQKTGILSLDLQGVEASIHFRDGEIIDAKYGKKNKTEAFYEIVRQSEGRFKFVPGIPDDKMDKPSIGNFMGLLMDSVRRTDEEMSR